MALRIKGAQVVTWPSATQDPSGQSINVPKGTDAVYMFWTAYLGASNGGLNTATLNGNSYDVALEIPSVASTYTGTGVAIWYNPASGARTLDIAWDATPERGVTCIVLFLSWGEHSLTGSDSDQNLGSNAVSASCPSQSGDIVFKYDGKFSSGTAPSLSGGWTNVATAITDQEAVRLSYIPSTGATVVADSEDEDYSTVIAISIAPLDAAVEMVDHRFVNDDGTES